MKKYSIADKTITIPDAYLEYNAFRRQCLAYAVFGQRAIFWDYYFRKDLDRVVNAIQLTGGDIDRTWFARPIKEIIQYTVKQCISKGIYDYDQNSLYNTLRDKGCFHYLEDDCEELLDVYSQLERNLSDNERARERRKDTRGRVVGGGFGIEGAVKGMLTAEGMNLAIGTGHSLVNFLGNAMDRLSVGKIKDKIYQSGKPLLMIQDALFDAANDMALIIAPEIFGLPIVIKPLDYDKAKSRLNNMEEGLLPEQVARDTIIEILQSDPEYQRVYRFKKYFTETEQKVLDQIAEDLDVFHEKAIYEGYASFFSFDSLSQEDRAELTLDKIKEAEGGVLDTRISLGLRFLRKGKNQEFYSTHRNFGYYLLEMARPLDETGKVAYEESVWLAEITKNDDDPDNERKELIQKLKDEAVKKEYTPALRDIIMPLYERGDKNDARRTIKKLSERTFEDKTTTLYVANFYLNGMCEVPRDYDKFEEILIRNKVVPGVEDIIKQLEKRQWLGDTKTNPEVAYAVARLYLNGYEGKEFNIARHTYTGLQYLEKALKNKRPVETKDITCLEEILQKEDSKGETLQLIKDIVSLLDPKENWQVDRLRCVLYEKEENFTKAEEIIYSLMDAHDEEAALLLEKYCVDPEGKVTLHIKDENQRRKFYQVLGSRGNKEAQNFEEIYQIQENLDSNKALALDLLRKRSGHDVKAKGIFRGEEVVAAHEKYDNQVETELASNLDICPESAYYAGYYLWMHQEEDPSFLSKASQYFTTLFMKGPHSPYLPDSYYARSSYYLGSFLIAHGKDSKEINYGKTYLQIAADAGVQEAKDLLDKKNQQIDSDIKTKKHQENVKSLPVKIAGGVLYFLMLWGIFKLISKVLSWIF